MQKAVDGAISAGYVTFISGMARGTDIWAAEIILQKKQYNNKLHLICVVPYYGFEKQRSIYEERRYKSIVAKADYVTTLSKHYYNGCYQFRNEFMVDHSNLVIAVWSGRASGTGNTVNYAKRKGVKVVNVLEEIQ